MKKILLLFFLALTSCSDVNYPLDNEQLSGGYICKFNNETPIVKADNVLKTSIYGKIIKYSYDKDFLLVVQEPSKENYIFNLTNELNSYYSLFANKVILNFKCDKDSCSSFVCISNPKLLTLFHQFENLNPLERNNQFKSISDSLVNNDIRLTNIFKNNVNYWIITHNERIDLNCVEQSKIYGPFTKQEFENERVILGVPNKLELNY
jgi:hypothetical protein